MPNVNDVVSAMAGSMTGVPAGTAGQTQSTSGFNYESAYKELQSKMGEMGNVVGNLRQENQSYKNFIDNAMPLLEKLDQSPDVVQAILDGKIDSSLAKAVYDGRIEIKDAAAVSQATQVVTKEIEKNPEILTPKQVEKMIEEKAREIRSEWDEKSDLQTLEQKTVKFIEATPDFSEFATEIDKWLDEHGDVIDVEVAYYAVKGKMSESAAQKTVEQIAAEGAKGMMQNASGGGVQPTAIKGGVSLIDQLVAGPANPNIF